MRRLHPWLWFWLALDGMLLVICYGITPLKKESSSTLTLMLDDQRLYHQIDHLDTKEDQRLRLIHSSDVADWPKLIHARPVDRPILVEWLKASNKKSIQSTDAASTLNPQKPTPHLLTIIDDWNVAQNQHLPIWPISLSPEAPLIILLDRSGTMKQAQAGQINALAASYRSLRQKREQEHRAWELYSFSDALVSHGTWTEDGPVPMDAFQSSKGQTRLFDALEKLLNQHQEPTKVVILSDGRIDTRHAETRERLLAHWRSRGHQIHLLSPDLHKLQEWEPEYQQGMIDHWPETKVVDQMGVEGIDPKLHIQWQHILPTQARQGLRPLLSDTSGHTLLYLQQEKDFLHFYAVAQPDKLNDLLDDLKKRFKHRPVVRIDKHTIGIDVGTKSLRPLIITSPWSRSILPYEPGCYQLEYSNETTLEAFHEDTGPFIIDNISSWQMATMDSTQMESHEQNLWNDFNLFFKSPSMVIKALLILQFLILTHGLYAEKYHFIISFVRSKIL